MHTHLACSSRVLSFPETWKLYGWSSLVVCCTCIPSTPILQRTVKRWPTRLNFGVQHSRKLLNWAQKGSVIFQVRLIKNQRRSAHQEEVSLHRGGVPGSEFEQTPLPDQLVGRVDHVLVSDHLVDLQHPLDALLRDRARNKHPDVITFTFACFAGTVSNQSNCGFHFNSERNLSHTRCETGPHFLICGCQAQNTRSQRLFRLKCTFG